MKPTHFIPSRTPADAVRDDSSRTPHFTQAPRIPHPRAGRCALADAAGERKGLVLRLAYGELRCGEPTSLRRHDLDMLRKQASIMENAVRSVDDIQVGTPRRRSGAPCRYWSSCCPTWRASATARRATARRATGYFGPPTTDDTSGDRTPSGGDSPKQLTPRRPRFTRHDLRHSAASLAVSAGTNVKAVQKMPRHASAAMMLYVYPDLFHDDLEAVASAMDGARTRSMSVRSASV